MKMFGCGMEVGEGTIDSLVDFFHVEVDSDHTGAQNQYLIRINR